MTPVTPRLHLTNHTEFPDALPLFNTAQSSAIKWILVSCFGYQGFSNAKFGRIECHEAINAFAREILLETKAVLEANGWRIVHGIVDSVWVTPIEGEEQTSLSELVSKISSERSKRAMN